MNSGDVLAGGLVKLSFRFALVVVISVEQDVRPVRPVLTAFSEDFALPSGEVGRVESWAFFCLAAIWAVVDMITPK